MLKWGKKTLFAKLCGLLHAWHSCRCPSHSSGAPTSLPATPGAPFSTFPSPCVTGQEHRHQFREGVQRLLLAWDHTGSMSSAGTHGVCFEHLQGQENIYRGRTFIGQETFGC